MFLYPGTGHITLAHSECVSEPTPQQVSLPHNGTTEYPRILVPAEASTHWSAVAPHDISLEVCIDKASFRMCFVVYVELRNNSSA
jgi:hypothetical protein